jgi:ribose transport system permease protein
MTSLAGYGTGVLPFVVLLTVVMAFAAPAFFSTANAGVIINAVGVTAIVGFSQLVVIAIGEMNLSVGAIGGLAAIATTGLMQSYGWPSWAAIGIGLALGAGCGALNGWIVVRTGLSAFLVTLASGSFFAGVSLGLTRAQAYDQLARDFQDLVNSDVLGIPFLAWPTLILAVILTFIFRYTGIGRQVLAVGANRRAAEFAGVPVARVRIVVQAVSGLLAALAAILLVARLGRGQPDLGGDWLLLSFAAPLIGGTVLTGGSVSVFGTVLGAILVALVANSLIFLNINSYWNQLFYGVIILAAMGAERVRDLLLAQSRRARA